MINAIRLPGLRKRSAPGVEVARLTALSLSVTMNAQPLSTASMDVPADDAQAEVGDFVELFDAMGSLGLFRVSAITYKYRRGRVQSLSLEHAIATLTQSIVFGELTYSEGSTTAYTVLQELLDKQVEKFWQIDETKVEELAYLQAQTGAFHFSDKDLLDALLDFQAFLPDETILTYDFSSFPWKVMTLRNPSAIDSEIRLSRNATTATISYDYTNVITRLYGSTGGGENSISLKEASKNPYGTVFIDADTVNRYGILSATYTDSSAETANELYDKCVKHLEKKKHPAATINIDALDLAKLTGETVDHFRAGYLCRLCIPEDDLTLTYQILRVDYADLCKEAARVSITMGTQERRKASKKMETKTSGGGSSSVGGPGGRTPNTEAYSETLTFTHAFAFDDEPVYSYTFTVGSIFTFVNSVTLYTQTYRGSSLNIVVNGGGGFSMPKGNAAIMGYLATDGGVPRDTPFRIDFTGAPNESLSGKIVISGKRIKRDTSN